MTRNMGQLDRAIRIAFAVVVAIAWLVGSISGGVALVMGVIAAVLLATGLIGTCPLYSVTGLSTNRRRDAAV